MATAPPIDFSGVAAAELTFEAFRDADGISDTAGVRFLRAADEVLLGEEVVIDMTILDIDYTSIEVLVPEAVIGESVIIEFQFSSDSSADIFSGLSLDNMRVQIP